MSAKTHKTTLLSIAMLMASLLFLAPASKAQGVNSPLPLELGVTAKASLSQDERNYYKVSLPAGEYKIILDSRRDDAKRGNLQSSLSILDRDGATLQEKAIYFNEIDVAYRRVHSFVLKTPTTMGFKLSNNIAKATFWLTILNSSDQTRPAFFGTVLPELFRTEQSTSGTLGTYESTYYIVRVVKGDYTVVLDFENSQGKSTNIQGYLALLNADGGDQRKIIGLNQIDVSYRKTAQLSFTKDEVLILRTANTNSRVNYTLKMVPAQPATARSSL